MDIYGYLHSILSTAKLMQSNTEDLLQFCKNKGYSLKFSVASNDYFRQQSNNMPIIFLIVLLNQHVKYFINVYKMSQNPQRVQFTIMGLRKLTFQRRIFGVFCLKSYKNNKSAIIDIKGMDKHSSAKTECIRLHY